MLKLLSSSLIALVLCVLSISAGHASSARFYQHIQHSNPEQTVRALIEEGWKVRNHAPLFLVPPIDWAEDPGDDNWSYQLNALYPLAPVFLSLAREYDPELHAFARLVFEDWIRFNIDEDRDHPFRWNDMATGVRAAYLAQLIYHERSHGSQVSLARFESIAVRHLQELANPENLAKNNHALTQLVGIVALCEVIDSSLCNTATTYAVSQYESLFGDQFNDEGIHLEHSPGYHLLAIDTFRRIEETGLLSLSREDRHILSLARKNLQYMIHPDRGFAEFGDTDSDNARRAGRFDPQARWLTSGGDRGTPPEAGAKLFRKSGLLSIRSLESQSLLYVSTAHNSRVHKHLDSGSFEWSDRGFRIIVDSGKWGYDEGPERDYVISQQAHNVVTTGGVSPSPGDLPAEVGRLRVVEEDGVFVVVARIPAPRRLIDADHTRFLAFNPGEWLVVADLVTEFLPSSQTQWFQFSPDATLTALEEGYRLRFSPDHLMAVVSLSGTDGKQFLGQREPLLGWYSPDYHKLVPSWQIGFEEQGRTVLFSTLFRWLGDESDSILPTPPVGSGRVDTLNFCWLEMGSKRGIAMQRIGNEWLPTSCTI